MSKILHIPLIAGLAALTACAGTAPASRPSTSSKVDESAVNALSAELDQASQRFEAGLALARTGDEDKAQAEIKASLDDLQATAVRCNAIPGCDASRFVSTYDRLLRLGVAMPAVDVDEEADAVVEAAPGDAEEASPVIANLPAMERTITLLKGRELADILTINDAVKAGLEQWLTQYRPNLMTAYVNYEFMRYRMWPEYHKAGLPEALLFGMLAKESGGRVHAVSRSGASGPLQFMYATGLRFGLGSSNGFDQRFDPALSARANAAYINEQLAIFNGNLELVVAAYNGGEGRIRRLAARGGSTSFWDPKVYSILPDETRDYVPMVLAAAWLFLHPERYNLEFPKIDGRPGTIALVEPASLAELTVCFGNEGGMYDGWFRALRNLNPAVDPQLQLPAGTRLEVPAQLEAAYAGRCASGPWMKLAEDLNHATRATTRPSRSSTSIHTVAHKTYKVRHGDNLARIARAHGCATTREIAEQNGIKAPQYRIRVGQSLHIPSCSKR
ncbi:MAG TPA: transglycosylase SLT domain-containing protein [Dokdonella sp.]|uniref:transglycosylase SLT domain-containing protein n=2 Tax=Dokdonella sp. TaxID=2291710 RepID=UPI002B8561A8|nr:transglycosylase SLT domain-containing protein [Dokdonella sp.]HOX72414.1 transglycosylase SLT domain-containing protein [Dokdonella sp.]HPG93112.1 transglycosylase SLT domain-containing protein [Dokdonella sp.]HPN79899.1 transglycosylase SLT domain-containing protein [Dokdonella sp.]